MDNVVGFSNALGKMEEWLSCKEMPPKLHRELETLENLLVADSGDREAKDEIYERFHKDLDFGTGGLRGIIGAGTNRVNIFTVRRVTQGFADYINRHYGGNDREPAVAVAYDSRNGSINFALESASVLAANGIRTHIYKELMPTPALSYAVRYFNCAGGIMITASHNPSNYNGYKVYNEEGCQVTEESANEILDCIVANDIFQDVKTLDMNLNKLHESEFFIGKLHEKISVIEDRVIDSYIEDLKATRAGVDCSNLEVVYTPLNGAGNKTVRRVLSEIGVKKIHIVREQEQPDGNFPTCPYPNPEKEQALLKGLDLCYRLKTPDLLLATDPDCDRLGIAVRQEDRVKGKISFSRITGNEIGILLLDFICTKRKLPGNPIAMKTIVSTKMADAIASSYGVEIRSFLTGFKYIGEEIGVLEKQGDADRFIFGFEESYGYLAGSYVRDKDAVNAAMLICEAASYYKGQGKTLIDRLEELYNDYGWYISDLMDFGFEGASGMLKMQEILKALRQQPPRDIIGIPVVEFTDYKKGKRLATGESCAMSAGYRPTNLPEADVLEYILRDGSSIIIRPSGTEPKLKIYLSAKGEEKSESINMIEMLKNEIKEWIHGE